MFVSKGGFETITDGTSNTAMFAEKHVDATGGIGNCGGNTLNSDCPRWNSGSGGWWGSYGELWLAGGIRQRGIASGPYVSGTNVHSTGTGCITTYGTNPLVGSWHPGVCNFLLVDGSVRPIAVTIDATTLANIAQRDDGQAVTIP